MNELTTVQERGHLSKFLHSMKKESRDGTTIILITRDMSIAAACTDRIVIMKEGKILMDDSTRQVFSQSDVLKQASIENPADNKTQPLREGSENVLVIRTILELEDLIGYPKSQMV